MKKVLFISLLFLALTTYVFAGTRPVEGILNATVIVYTENGGMGAGVIISPTGYILTANHVISRGGRIFTVVYETTKLLQAELIWNSPAFDIALLKIEREGGFPHKEFGVSDAILVGDQVSICGHTGGLAWMYTTGIMTARKYTTEGQEYLLTDSWGYQGNSGGGMFNADGDLVGIVQLSVVGYIVATSTDWLVPVIPGIIHVYETMKANQKMLEQQNEQWKKDNKELIEEFEREQERAKAEAEEQRKKWADEYEADRKKYEEEKKREERRKHIPDRFS